MMLVIAMTNYDLFVNLNHTYRYTMLLVINVLTKKAWVKIFLLPNFSLFIKN